MICEIYDYLAVPKLIRGRNTECTVPEGSVCLFKRPAISGKQYHRLRWRTHPGSGEEHAS